MSKQIKIGVCVMVKNEERNIEKTLRSSKDIAAHFIILDTGSTDNTIQIIKDTAKDLHIPLTLKQNIFIDFSTSRNWMLDFANDVDVDYLCLLDCNDEIRNGVYLAQFLQTYPDKDAFIITLHWLDDGKIIKHVSSRFMKNNKKYRYKYPVHECLVPVDGNRENTMTSVMDMPENILYYYQDRNDDDKIKSERYKRDVDILLKEYEKDPTDTRVIYYLAQSYYFSEDYENARFYYQKRIDHDEERKSEEVLDAYMKIGRAWVYEHKNWQEAVKYMWAAYEYCDINVEPVIYMAEHYLSEKRFVDAYYLLKIACHSKYPSELKLHVPDTGYRFYRYEMMSRAAEAVGVANDCVESCQLALNFLESTPIFPKREELIKGLTERRDRIMIKNEGRVDRVDRVDREYIRFSSKPFILIFAGWEYKQWNGFSLNEKGGLGGSETSAVLIGEALLKYGYSVVICCDTKEQVECRGIKYIRIDDYEDFLDRYEVDHLIILRYITALRYYPNIKNVYIWLQDMDPIYPPDGSKFELDHPKLRGVISLTRKHQNYLLNMTPDQFKPMIKCIGNAITPHRFAETYDIVPMRFIYSSCPSRGLERLLPVFKMIHKKYPHAELHIFSNFESEHAKKKIDVKAVLKEIDETEGVINRGRVSQDKLTKEMGKADYWIYFSKFEETYCISALEAQASRCVCLYSPLGSLPEVVGNRGIPIESDEEKEILETIDYLEDNQDVKEEYRTKAREWALTQSYESRVEEWIKLFHGKL